MSKILKSNRLLCVFVIIFILLFISSPNIYMQSCLEGLNVWFFNVLPALFPFFVATRLLILFDIDNIPLLDKLTKKLFGVNGGGKFFLLSLLSGYPVGAKLVCDAHKNGQIDEISAKKMLSFCSVSGPMFVVGTVGVAIFHSIKIGYILLFCHIMSAIINGLVFRRKYGKVGEKITKRVSRKSKHILADSMVDSINSILLVGGYIVLAYVLIDALNFCNIVPLLSNFVCKIPFLSGQENVICAILNGIVEMTRGVVDVASFGLNTKVLLPVVSFLIGFGGFSVFFQSTTFMQELNIKKPTYLFQKFCQGIWAMIVALVVCIFV